MADIQKPRFTISVTPIVELGETDNKHAAMTVLHEEIRASIGGGGVVQIADDDLFVGGTFDGGESTPVTSNTGTLITLDGGEDLLYIRHTGLLFGTTNASAATDGVNVSLGGQVIASLQNGEAIVLPRPASGVLSIASLINHVGIDWITFGTTA